jgi:hypothetical protein
MTTCRTRVRRFVRRARRHALLLVALVCLIVPILLWQQLPPVVAGPFETAQPRQPIPEPGGLVVMVGYLVLMMLRRHP